MAVAVDLHQRLLLRGAPDDPLGVHDAVGSRDAPGLRHVAGRGAERLAQPRRRDLAIQRLLWSSPLTGTGGATESQIRIARSATAE